MIDEMSEYTVIVTDPEPTGWWVARCPAMPGAITQGATRDEALSELAGVMAAWLDIAAEQGFGPLEDTADVVAEQLALVLQDQAEEGLPMVVATVMLAPALAHSA